MKIGYQLSSIAPYLTEPESLAKSFRKISGIGYRFVQLQGIPSEIDDQFIVDVLTEENLDCVATQEDYPLGFGEDPKRAISRAIKCGARYLCCALIPREVDSVKRLEQFAEELSNIAENVRDAGLIFAFHPIAPDFREMEGKPVFDRLMALLPEHVQLTFCVHAAFASGTNPLPIFKKYAGRMDLIHLKDDATMPDGSRHLMPLGRGTQIWAPILQAAQEAGVKYIFAEQERWLKDAFECAEESYRYLKGLGLANT